MLRLLAAVCVVVLMSGCAVTSSYVPANAPASVGAPQVKAGDYWDYTVRDGYTGLPRGIYRYQVANADAERVVVQLIHEERLLDTLIYAPGWNGRELPLTNTQRFRYEPTYVAYPYPLTPGKTWYTVVRATDTQTGRQFNTHVKGKILGWERISVPAGQFDALKIQREVFAGNMQGFKTQEEISEIDWYVPSARRAVRTQAHSQHFDTSRGGSDGGGEYPERVRGDFLISELTAYSQ
ncbi:MAG TPA: hypothetical protein VFI62_06430 [Burkholderiales bacterium]|nr:hypothetical protein [Burkholderiales bacterium]